MTGTDADRVGGSVAVPPVCLLSCVSGYVVLSAVIPARIARAAYDKAADADESARKALFDEILTGLEEGMGPSAVGRHSGFTREYVARIRDGKVKGIKDA